MRYNTNTNEVAYKNVYHWLLFNQAISTKNKNKTLKSKNLMDVLQTKYQLKCTKKSSNYLLFSSKVQNKTLKSKKSNQFFTSQISAKVHIKLTTHYLNDTFKKLEE